MIWDNGPTRFPQMCHKVKLSLLVDIQPFHNYSCYANTARPHVFMHILELEKAYGKRVLCVLKGLLWELVAPVRLLWPRLCLYKQDRTFVCNGSEFVCCGILWAEFLEVAKGRRVSNLSGLELNFFLFADDVILSASLSRANHLKDFFQQVCS